MPVMRPAREYDAGFIASVYNEAIAAGDCTCDTVPVTVQNRLDWIASHPPGEYPIFICEDDGRPVGYSYITPYRPGRLAVRHVAEVSYYLSFSAHGRRIGSYMLEQTEKEAAARGIKVLVAILLASNAPSVGLLKKFGYLEWGRLPGIVDFGGRRVDHLVYGKYL